MLIHDLDGAHAKKILIFLPPAPDYAGQAQTPTPSCPHSTPFHIGPLSPPGPLQRSFITNTVHPLSPLLHNSRLWLPTLTRLCPGSEVCALPDLRPIYLPASSPLLPLSPHTDPFPPYPTHCNLPTKLAPENASHHCMESAPITSPIFSVIAQYHFLPPKFCCFVPSNLNYLVPHRICACPGWS